VEVKPRQDAAGPEPGAAQDQTVGGSSVLGMLGAETAPAGSRLGLGPPSQPQLGPKHTEITEIPLPTLFFGQFPGALAGEPPPTTPHRPKMPFKGTKNCRTVPSARPCCGSAQPALGQTGAEKHQKPPSPGGGEGVGVNKPHRSDKIQQRG